MEAVAYIKYLRTSPKKIKKLAQLVVGLSPQVAMDRLHFSGTKGAKLLIDSIKSAQATAVNNLKLDTSTLRIKTIEVLKGPILKRWQPVSRGMVHQIKKRNTHIKVIVHEVLTSPVKKPEQKVDQQTERQKTNAGDLKRSKLKREE